MSAEDGMTVFDRCSWERVQVVLGNGPRTVMGWRCGDLAANEHPAAPDRWTITHLPTGLSFSSLGLFANAETAIQAMLEVSPLRNDWTSIDYDELASLKARCKPIFERHKAAPSSPFFTQTFQRDLLHRRLNGYAG